jgi:hypothetical protein
MSYALWTRQAVSELIEVRYGARLTVHNTGKYLGRWGFTPQKPLKKVYEQSPAAVSKWLDETYAAIAQRAKQAGAEIQWGDEIGLRSDDVRGRGYAPKGQTPVVRANANCQSLSVISTVTNKGTMYADGAVGKPRQQDQRQTTHILLGKSLTRGTGDGQREIAQHRAWRGLFQGYVGHADRDLLLIGPCVPLLVAVERCISAIELRETEAIYVALLSLVRA